MNDHLLQRRLDLSHPLIGASKNLVRKEYA